MNRINFASRSLGSQSLAGRQTVVALAVTATILSLQAAPALAADPVPAVAAAAMPAAAASDAANDSVQLGRVTVSAQKREQASIDVPASVTAINTARFVSGGFKRIEDYAAEIPGMSFSSQRQGMTQVTLRGITTGVTQAAPTTSFYIDEAPIGSMNAYAAGSTITPDIDPADLRQIEVLKGPQGTLYGAGALGGIVRYVTQPVDFEKFGGSITLGSNAVEHGGNGYVGRVSMNIPLDGKSMALRVSAFGRDDAGFIDNPTTGQREVNKAHAEGGRVAFGWKLSNDWSLQASALAQKIKSDGASEVDVDHATLAPLSGALSHSSYVPEAGLVDMKVYNVTLKGNVGNYSLVSSTTYETINSSNGLDGTPFYGALLGPSLHIPTLGVSATTLIDTKRWTQEFRLRSSAFSDKLEYEGGLFLTKEKSSFLIPGFMAFDTATGAALPLPPIVKASIVSEYREASLFANASYAITPSIDIQAGVRYGQDSQTYGQVYEGLLVGPVPVTLNKTSDDRKATWLLSARWKPTADDSVYVRAANGYRPGGPNAVPPAGVTGAQQTFEPDSLVSYELGFKSIFAGGHASFEAAVFYTDWENIQILTGAQGYNFYVNGGTARSRGAEATLYWVPIAGLNLRASAAYTDATLTSAAPAAGGLNGDRLPFVPKLTSSVTADYRWGLSSGWSATLGGSINFTGSRISTFSQLFPVEAPSYTTFNLYAGLESASWRLSLYGKNLGDARGVTSVAALGFSPAFNPYVKGVIVPRTIGVEGTYKF